jgi:hypothetical protein
MFAGGYLFLEPVTPAVGSNFEPMSHPEEVAKSFLQAYYQTFVANRPGLANFYVRVVQD